MSDGTVPSGLGECDDAEGRSKSDDEVGSDGRDVSDMLVGGGCWGARS